MATYTPHRVGGQLAAAKGTLYEVPASTSAIVKSIRLVNATAGALTVNLYFKSGTSRRAIPKDYSLAAGALLEVETADVLLTTDLVEGDASAATSVDYWISFILVTA